MKYGFLLVACSLLFGGPCMAVHKCVDAEGNVSFSQTPCSGTDTGTEINVEGAFGTNSDPRACELAGLYAEDAARRMREGSDFSREISRYGGPYGAKPALVGLVNYIHSFRAADASPVRIGSLARAKCQTLGFGPMAFEDLPVSEYYTYDKNRGEWVRQGQTGSLPAQPSLQDNREPSVAAPTSQGLPASQSVFDTKQECERIKAQLKGMEAQMRSGYDSSQSDSLREQRRSLQEMVKGVCK